MKFFSAALVAVFSMFTLSSAEAQVSRVCKRTISSRGHIYKNSAPLRNSSGNISGFRQEPTLIMNSNISTKGRAAIFDSRGRQIGSCPWASASGHRGGRYRCTMSTRSLRQTALRNTRRAAIFIRTNSRSRICMRIRDVGRCEGSVKGLCDRLIS